MADLVGAATLVIADSVRLQRRFTPNKLTLISSARRHPLAPVLVPAVSDQAVEITRIPENGLDLIKVFSIERQIEDSGILFPVVGQAQPS